MYFQILPQLQILYIKFILYNQFEPNLIFEIKIVAKMMFKPQQFLKISLPIYLQSILNVQLPKKQLFQLSYSKNVFTFMGQIFLLCENTIKDSSAYQVYLKFIRQSLAINLQQKNHKTDITQSYSNNIQSFFHACCCNMLNSFKKIYSQIYMLFIRLFEAKCTVELQQTQQNTIKNIEKSIMSLYSSIKLILSFESQYSRIQVKDYVELALSFLLQSQISKRFKKTLNNLIIQCQFSDSTVQLIEKASKLPESKLFSEIQHIKTISKAKNNKAFSEKEMFRNKRKNKLLNRTLAYQKIAQKRIMQMPQKQNKDQLQFLNFIHPSQLLERTPQYKCLYDIGNPEVSKSPFKNSSKRAKINWYFVSPCSSKKTHFIKKNQDRKKKKSRTLYDTRKGIFNNFRKRIGEQEIDFFKTPTQTSIYFDSARKSHYNSAIIEHNLDDHDILAHQTPKPKATRARIAKIPDFKANGNFQLVSE